MKMQLKIHSKIKSRQSYSVAVDDDDVDVLSLIMMIALFLIKKDLSFRICDLLSLPSKPSRKWFSPAQHTNESSSFYTNEWVSPTFQQIYYLSKLVCLSDIDSVRQSVSQNVCLPFLSQVCQWVKGNDWWCIKKGMMSVCEYVKSDSCVQQLYQVVEKRRSRIETGKEETDWLFIFCPSIAWSPSKTKIKVYTNSAYWWLQWR